MAKAKLQKANAELSLSQVHLEFTQIRAPFDGIVDRFHVRLGSLVDEGELLTSLSDNNIMWVYYNVPEAEYLDYQSNLTTAEKPEVKLLMANNAYFKHPGIVETIEADFNCHTEAFGPDDCEHEIELVSWSVEDHKMPNSILESSTGAEMLRRLEAIAWEQYSEYDGPDNLQEAV